MKIVYIARWRLFATPDYLDHDLVGLSWSRPNEILVILSWALILGNFFVYCFADAPPTYIDLKGNHRIFRFSEKASNIWNYFPLGFDITLSNVKYKWKITPNACGIPKKPELFQYI